MNNIRWMAWFGLAALLMACVPPAVPTPIVMPTPNELARTSDAHAVTVDIVPRNLYDAAAGTIEFEVTLSTHSVDLNYDFAALATLRSDAGDEVAALKWDGPSGGHHVFGVLSFPVLKARGQTITLVLRGIAEVPERTFEWSANR